MEIYQDTIIQNIVRQGTDSSRKLITLKSGELGYTVDTERLYVGNGVLSGGNIVGNLFKGSYPTITGLIGTTNSIALGDFGYSTDNNSLYALSATDSSALSSWQKIGGVYSSGDSFINVSTDNKITFQSNQKYVCYSGSLSATQYSKNTTATTKISTGYYKTTFPTLTSANYIPIAQLYGHGMYDYYARVVTYDLSSCDVRIQNLTGGSVDGDFFLSINY